MTVKCKWSCLQYVITGSEWTRDITLHCVCYCFILFVKLPTLEDILSLSRAIHNNYFALDCWLPVVAIF